MPLTAGGDLKIVAKADLGGLGAVEGSAVHYQWTMPSAAPLVAPWLILVGLLLVKSNRRAAAWLIWLPVGVGMVLNSCLTSFFPSGLGMLLDVMAASLVGLGSVWLLAPHLRQSHRFLTFLLILLALAGFGLLALLFKASSLWDGQLFVSFVILGFSSLVCAAALSLGGVLCRSRYRPFQLGLWLFILFIVVWTVIAMPFMLMALFTSGGNVEWMVFYQPVLMVAICQFGMVLPFLILSAGSPFYRERLKLLLHVKPETPPPLPETAASNQTPPQIMP